MGNQDLELRHNLCSTHDCPTPKPRLLAILLPSPPGTDCQCPVGREWLNPCSGSENCFLHGAMETLWGPCHLRNTFFGCSLTTGCGKETNFMCITQVLYECILIIKASNDQKCARKPQMALCPPLLPLFSPEPTAVNSLDRASFWSSLWTSTKIRVMFCFMSTLHFIRCFFI